MHSKLKETLSKYNTIILVGGGTGGHIQPIISLAQELTEKNLLWIGGRHSNEAEEARKTTIPFRSISTLKLPTTRSPKILFYPFSLLFGVFESWTILKKKRKNSCVFSKGGPGSLAIGIAAWLLRIPIYIHESDTIPGRSNRILGKFATKIFLGFEGAIKFFDEKKCVTIGQILNPSFSLDSKIEQQRRKIKDSKEASNQFVPHYERNPLAWNTTKPHILVICGSQGARSIFEAIIQQFYGNENYEWIIALGKLNSGMGSDFGKMKNTQALEWIPQEKIAELLCDTSLVITRGSATTLAEIDVFKVKKIIVPLPYAANNHQYWNAKEYEKNGDILLEQKDLISLYQNVEKIVGQNSQPSNI